MRGSKCRLSCIDEFIFIIRFWMCGTNHFFGLQFLSSKSLISFYLTPLNSVHYDILWCIFLFQMGGGVVMGVGIWTLVDKGEYLSLLASSTFAVSAYILILAGGLVMVTGFLGCCAVIREQRSCLSTVRGRRWMWKATLRGRNFAICANFSIVLHSLDVIALDPSLFLVNSVIVACKLRWAALCVQRQSRTGSMAAMTN